MACPAVVEEGQEGSVVRSNTARPTAGLPRGLIASAAIITFLQAFRSSASRLLATPLILLPLLALPCRKVLL